MRVCLDKTPIAAVHHAAKTTTPGESVTEMQRSGSEAPLTPDPRRKLDVSVLGTACYAFFSRPRRYQPGRPMPNGRVWIVDVVRALRATRRGGRRCTGVPAAQCGLWSGCASRMWTQVTRTHVGAKRKVTWSDAPSFL